METFAKHSERYLSGGRQKITQRVQRCQCGCNGTDPWHARHIKRVIKEIEVFNEPYRSKTSEGHHVTICAVGRYKHPAGWMPCGLEVIKNVNGDYWVTFHWITLDTIGDYGTAECHVEPGEYIPWAQRLENQEFLAEISRKYPDKEEGS
jgi:hypothetical protein